MTCGANTTSMVLVLWTMSARAQLTFGLAGMRHPAMGSAARTMSAVSGSRMIMPQVSSAEVICATRALACGSVAARPAERAGHRDHRVGQRPAQGKFVDEVGHLVGGDVRRSQAARADALREHEGADQLKHPGQRREAGNERGTARDPRCLAR